MLYGFVSLFFREQNKHNPAEKKLFLSTVVEKLPREMYAENYLGEGVYFSLSGKVEVMGLGDWPSPCGSPVWDKLFLQHVSSCKSTWLDCWMQNLSPRVNKNSPHYIGRIIQLLCVHYLSQYHIFSNDFKERKLCIVKAKNHFRQQY